MISSNSHMFPLINFWIGDGTVEFQRNCPACAQNGSQVRSRLKKPNMLQKPNRIQFFGHDELIVMSGVSLLGEKHWSLREIKLFKRYAKLCVEERFKPNTPYFLQLLALVLYVQLHKLALSPCLTKRWKHIACLYDEKIIQYTTMLTED